MKPFFKWSGGKGKELKHVHQHMPKIFNTYYEPFIGGGAVWLNLEPKSAVVGDTYFDVINFYSILRDHTDNFVDKINSMAELYNKVVLECHSKEDQQAVADEFYYPYRDNIMSSDFDKAVAFYILRQLSFSGMLRFGSKGKFNVPYGWYKSLKKIEYTTTDLAILKRTQLFNQTWQQTVSAASSKDFVFLDPPYTRKFVKYHPDGDFGQDSHVELANWFKSKQAMAMIIINKDEFTYNLYKDFIVEEYDKRYSIMFRDRMTEQDSNSVHFVAINY